MKPRIINVIEVIENSVSSVESFVIKDKKEEQKIVAKAEALFLKKAQENGAGTGEDNEEELLDDAYFVQGDYYVCLTWSDVK